MGKTILISAFSAFGQYIENTSEWAARAAEGDDIQVRVLPVKYDAAAQMLAESIAQIKPAFLISMGQAGDRKHVSIENTAWNEDSSMATDNNGEQRLRQPINPSGPPSYKPEFPREKLMAALTKRGFDIRPSDDPGRFVCNNLYYRTAAEIAPRSPSIPYTFIHVPGPETWDRDTAEEFGRMLAWELTNLVMRIDSGRFA